MFSYILTYFYQQKPLTQAVAALVFLFLLSLNHLAQAGSGTVTDPFTSFSQAHNAPNSGRYFFAIGTNTFEADVDTSEGGGWVLVLQYLHKAATNPDLNVINAGDSFPNNSTATLGADESTDLTRWGHAGNAALSQFSGEIETRWFGQTSAHSRVIHFQTKLGDNYLKTGSGNYSGINTQHTLLTGHSANIPAVATNYYGNQGNLAMTSFPYWLWGRFHWGIKGGGNRWEVDDYARATADTIHKIWVRETPIISNVDLTITKSVDVWDPSNSNLYALPGNDVIYTITVTNEGGTNMDSGSIFLVDKIPTHLTFYNGDIDDAGPETNAVKIEDNASGLTIDYAADIAFSDASAKPTDMTQCNYSPASGYDQNITHICIWPTGLFQAGPPNPSIAISFRSRID